MQLDSRISAVITGGASGLGAATARRLAANGVKVALFDLNVEKGEALAAELGGVFCRVDVTSDDQVDAAFAKARAAIGQERILVNCAGTGNAIKTASFDKATGQPRHFPMADFAMQRKVPIRLIWMIFSKAASGKCLGCPVALSKLAVLIALPVPAQLTRMLSCPMAARALAKAAST